MCEACNTSGGDVYLKEDFTLKNNPETDIPIWRHSDRRGDNIKM
jgi:hypothetical protein